MALHWYERDDDFRAELERGHQQATLVAEELRRSGLDVEQGPLRFRNTFEDRHDFSDEADLTVQHPRHGSLLVEVKCRDVAFDDQPGSFPMPACIVDPVAKYDQKLRRRLAYVMVSRTTGSMLVVSTRSEYAWRQRDIFDPLRRFSEPVYLCPRSLLLPLDVLVDWLRRP